jgi:hypothetical protein
MAAAKRFVVEKKRARVLPGGKGPAEPDKPSARHAADEDVAHPPRMRAVLPANRGGVVLARANEDEKEARCSALTGREIR